MEQPVSVPVYADILLTINFVVDYFLLRLTSILLGRGAASKRLLLSAAASSLTSLMVFLPPLPPLWSVAVNLVLSGGIVRLAFPWRGRRDFFSGTVVFYCVNLLFAGGIFLLCQLKPPRGLLFLNGAVYFQMSPLLLIACAALLYALSLLFQRELTRGRVTARTTEVVLEAEGVQVKLRGYLDTANHLTDAFSGLPVVLCTAAALKPVIGEEGVRWVEERRFLAEPQPEGMKPLKPRLIPFSGMGGDGVLPGFLPQGLWMAEKNGERRPFRAAVAVTASPFRQGYDILLNPEAYLEDKRDKGADAEINSIKI